MDSVLSIFPGIDLFGRAFELEGFAVFLGRDRDMGTGDIRDMHVPRRLFNGIIAGSPCQDFSTLNRTPTGYGLLMLAELQRIIREASPVWWVLENVPTVPDLIIDGYSHQRIDLRASDFGSRQSRLRHFQFGHARGKVLCIDRPPSGPAPAERCCLASEGTKTNRRGWRDFCMLQGLPDALPLPNMTLKGRYRAVGNGVPIELGRAIARGIRDSLFDPGDVTVCACSCGRPVTGKQKTATMACRQRLSRKRRDRARPRRIRTVTA